MPDAPAATAPDTSKTASEAAPGDAPELSQDELDLKVYKELNGGKGPEDDFNMPGAGSEEAAEEDPGEQPRGEDGKFLPKGGSKPGKEETKQGAEETDKEPGETAEQKPAKDEKKPEKKPAPDRETRRKLIAAKEIVGRVLKYDDDKLDSMPDDELLDLGQRLAKVHGDFERVKQDLQKRKDRDRTQKGEDADTPDDGPRRSRDPVDRAESEPAEPDTGGVDKLLREYLDPETYTKVKAGQRAERARFQDQATKMQERAEAAETALRADRIDVARGRVAEKFPQLNDDAKFMQLIKAMDEMDPIGERAKGDLSSFVKFVERCAWAEFGEDVERTTRQRLVTGNRKDLASQPRTSNQSGQSAVMSQDDYDNAVGRLAQECTTGGQFDQAKFDAGLLKIPKPKT